MKIATANCTRPINDPCAERKGRECSVRPHGGPRDLRSRRPVQATRPPRQVLECWRASRATCFGLIFAHSFGGGSGLACQLIHDEQPWHDDQEYHDQGRDPCRQPAPRNMSNHPGVERPCDDCQSHPPGQGRQEREREQDAQCNQRKREDRECDRPVSRAVSPGVGFGGGSAVGSTRSLIVHPLLTQPSAAVKSSESKLGAASWC